jgi:N-acyl-D-amino-acid deacylase
MTRVHVILLTMLLIGGCVTPASPPPPPPPPAPDAQPRLGFDLLIRNARIIDGTGNASFRGDIAIRGDRIAAIGNLGKVDAVKTIDASGLVAAPGFIDVHTHADDGLYTQPRAENFIRDGVTTIVTGNCGYGVTDVGDYFDKLKQRGVALNVATLIGHNTVLRAVKGNRAGELTPEQLDRARQIVRDAMEDGAVGLSTGLIYTPGQWSSTEEIIELAKVAAAPGGLYATHMRSESTEILKAIDEALRIGREANCRVQISHFKLPADMARKLGGSDVTLQRVIDARAAGQEVWLDQYPYTASSTSISTLVPDKFLEAGPEAARKLMADPAQLPTVLEGMRQNHEVERGRRTLGYAVIASCEAYPQYVGQNLEQVARAMKLLREDPNAELLGATLPEVTMQDQYRAVIDIYVKGGASVVLHSMNEQEVVNILRNPLVAVASDSGVREFGVGQPHPRGYGTNARVLGRYVREQQVIPLEEAVRKMTSMPAHSFRLTDRGTLREGFIADLTLFNPDTVIDRATFEKPHAYAEGIEQVIVNGQLVLERGRMTGVLPGRALRGPGFTDVSK